MICNILQETCVVSWLNKAEIGDCFSSWKLQETEGQTFNKKIFQSKANCKLANKCMRWRGWGGGSSSPDMRRGEGVGCSQALTQRHGRGGPFLWCNETRPLSSMWMLLTTITQITTLEQWQFQRKKIQYWKKFQIAISLTVWKTTSFSKKFEQINSGIYRLVVFAGPY